MAFSLLQPLREIPLAFVDTETTGVSVDYGHRVIELGIVRVEAGRRVAEYQQLIDPARGIGLGVQALTGITPAMVNGQPRFHQQLHRALELMQGAILIGHNVRFDLSFLNFEFRRSGVDMAVALAGSQVMDTLRLARRKLGRGGNGLQRLARRLAVAPVVAHRALADAQTTHLVFEKLLGFLAGWDTALADVWVAHGPPMGIAPANGKQTLLPLELEEALEQKTLVRMEYLDARDQRTERIVQPLQLRRVGGEMILVAHCQLRDAQRTFKLDRIVQLRRLDEVGADEIEPIAIDVAAVQPAPPLPAAGENEILTDRPQANS